MDDLLGIVLLSLRVSAIATVVSLLIGLPLGTGLALSRNRGKRVVLSVINTGMAVPPVVAGLVIALLLWRSGPFGFLELIYTPAAIVIAEVVIATPVILGLTAAGIDQLDPRLQLQLRGLGASRPQMVWRLWREARLSLLAAVMAGFGRVISEVGAATIVGGNIAGQTRVLTTAIVLNVGRGDFASGLALGALLLVIAFVVNWVLTWAQQSGNRRSA